MSEKYNLLEKIIKKLRKSVSTEEQNFTEEEKDRIRKNIGALSDATNTLPNPNKLIFTGAITGEYDGSNEMLVAIPTGENSGTSGVHVGPDEPTDPSVEVWFDTDEDASEGSAIDSEMIKQAVDEYMADNPIDIDLSDYARTEDIPTDDHINSLINTALAEVPNAAEVAY
jgi:hypothetical protein